MSRHMPYMSRHSRTCLPRHCHTYLVIAVHASSLPYMPRHSRTCLVIAVHASSLPYMPRHCPICLVIAIHASSLPYMHVIAVHASSYAFCLSNSCLNGAFNLIFHSILSEHKVTCIVKRELHFYLSLNNLCSFAIGLSRPTRQLT